MPRKLRIQDEGMIHHVITRGNSQTDVFKTDNDRRKYLNLILRYKARYFFKVYAYCLMDNHIHLLIEEGKFSLSKIMQGIQQSYTQYYNKKYGETGHVFEQRYKSIPCSSEAYLERLIAYIHMNPIEAGIAKRVDEYLWSGHNEIAKKTNNPIIDRRQLYFLIGGEEGKQSYLEIVHNFSNLSQETVKDAYLSAEKIEERLDDLFFEKVTINKRDLLSVDEVNNEIHKVFKDLEIKIKKSDYNKLFVPLAYQYSDSNRNEISTYLGISPSRVSNINREYEEGKFPEELRKKLVLLLTILKRIWCKFVNTIHRRTKRTPL